MKTQNSFSTALSQFLRLNTNALTIFERINEAITSSAQTVTVDLFDDNNNLTKITIPSFGYLQQQITNLQNNVANLSGTGTGDSNVRLPDGTFRKIIVSELEVPAANITTIATPTQFEYNNNWFFDQFLNPTLS